MAFYDSKPSVLEAVGNGSYRYRYNIEEIDAPEGSMESADEPSRKLWTCEEVLVWAPLTANKVTEAVIASRWDSNYEQKLINEYNAAKLGVYGSTTSDDAKAKIAAYKDFLQERIDLKAQVDADCEALGVI
jgi:hypothetical protein